LLLLQLLLLLLLLQLLLLPLLRRDLAPCWPHRGCRLDRQPLLLRTV